MDICYVNPTNNMRRPIAELAQIFANQGNHVSIMFPVSKICPTKNWVANERIEQTKIKQIAISSRYFNALRYSVPNIFQLFTKTRKIFKEHAQVHIWEYFYPLSVFVLFYALITGQRKKVILTTDGFVGYSYNPKEPRWLVPIFRIYTQTIARFLFRIPPRMTTYGKAMQPHAKKAGVPMQRLNYLSTGIHLQDFSVVEGKTKDQLRKEFGITTEKVVLFVGMLTQRKGIDKVIAVATQLLHEDKNVKILIVGDAHGKNEFAHLVPEIHKENIVFVGGRKDVATFMAISNVLLLPSVGEGLPGVVMEAMASGLPVVATNEGCTADLVTSGKEGMLVPIEGDYFTPVRKILRTPEYAQMLSLAAKQKISLFCWSNVALQYRALYER